MKVQIRKHYDYLTPFKEAQNEEELAEIMRLKYPKACGDLETDASFFAQMVEDVQKYEAWKVIGYKSFESFCKEKLGKTLDEVQAIVTGVRELQKYGKKNITEAEALATGRKQPILTSSEAGKRGGRGNKRDTKVYPLQGQTPTYLSRRLCSQYPEIFKKLEQGNYASVHAAAIEAGIVKPTASVPKTKEGFAAYIKRTFTPSEIRWIKDQL